MAISNTNVELRKDDIETGTPVDCDLEVFSADEIILYYGNARETAVVDTDYTVTLDNTNDAEPAWPTTFSFTPLASLLTKIGDLIAADETEENVVFVRRKLDYTTDFNETDAFLRSKIAREFDRTIMRFQQLSYDTDVLLAFAAQFEEDAATLTAAAAATEAWRDEAEGFANSAEADKDTVAADKAIVAGYKDDVAADKATVANDKAIVAGYVEDAEAAQEAAEDAAEDTDNDRTAVAADKTTVEGYKDDAETAQAAAEAARADAEEALADLLDRYLGPFAVAPTETPNGNPLAAGMLYYHTGASPGMRVRKSDNTWDAAFVPADGYATTGYVDSAVSAVQGDVDDLDGRMDDAESDIDALETGKADDDAVVHDTGDETVAGVKTFSSIPVGPNSNPTTDNQLARKKYVDDQDATKEPLGAVPGINTQTDSYTLVLTDAGKIVEINSADPENVTVPPNGDVAFPINTRVDIVAYGAGAVTLVAGSGVTIRSKDDNLVIDGQYAGVSLYKRGTNEWVALGALTS